MRALGRIIDRLAAGAIPQLIDKVVGTDSFFVMRAGSPTSDGRGGTRKTYSATTVEAISCTCAVIASAGQPDLERIAAERQVSLVFRRMVCAAEVDCTTKDRVKLVARGATPELAALEVVRSVLLSGALREIVTVEEQRVLS